MLLSHVCLYADAPPPASMAALLPRGPRCGADSQLTPFSHQQPIPRASGVGRLPGPWTPAGQPGIPGEP